MKIDVRTLVAALAFVLFMGALGWRAVSALPAEVERDQKQACLPLSPDPTWQPRPAKDFTLTDWKGRSISLADYRGRVVFLNFWATWCPPCRDEAESLERLATALEGNKDF